MKSILALAFALFSLTMALPYPLSNAEANGVEARTDALMNDILPRAALTGAETDEREGKRQISTDPFGDWHQAPHHRD